MIVLASTSKYRAELLSRLGLTFASAAPTCDEALLAAETASARCARLAEAKANSLVKLHAQHVIIGSDQVASCNGRILRKPGSVANAIAQLTSMSEQAVQFHTGLCVIDSRSGRSINHVDLTTAHLRRLSSQEIERYVEQDKPLDCAGSFKVESLGIALFERIDSTDPSALIGLPLMALSRALRQFGLNLP